MSRQQVTIATQLFKSVTTMRHIDELLQWLVYAFVQNFDLQLGQFWTAHINSVGQLTLQLRTMVGQDPSLPQQVVVNNQTSIVAQRIANERRPYPPQPVENLFSHYQTSILRRYGLNYCGGCFISSNVLIPALDDPFSQKNPPTFLAMSTLLFLRQIPNPNLVPTIGVILEQAIALAESRGLLVSANTSQPLSSLPSPVTPSPVPPPSLTLAELIPRRKQDAAVMLSSNPFARPSIISSKQARQLYTAIDGRMNISDLCNTLGMNIKEVSEALQPLLAQQRIDLYEPDGRLANAALFFDKR